MTNKFYSFRSFAPENGSGMDRLCIGTTTMKSRKLFSLLFVLILGIGQMWATNYSITFKTGTNTTASTSTTKLSTMIQSGVDNVTGFTIDGTNKYVYHAGAAASNATGSGLRLGKSGGIGKITFNLSSTISAQNLTSISISTTAWDASTTVSLYVNGGATAAATATAGNPISYTPSTTTQLSSITLYADKRAFIGTITIVATSGGGGGSTPTTCATPTFSPVAGSYIGTQSVTISSTTTGSTIYYTTNGSTPTTSSSHGTAGAASATVSVSSSQTLKAIAVKDGSTNSEVGTAAYTIVSCDNDNFEWNLATNSFTIGTNEVTWSGTYATMHNEGTNATNYLGGDANNRTSSRFYSGNTLTITPASGTTISHVVFTATTETYATTLGSSTWTNASASTSGTTVIVTPTDGTSAFSASVGGTCGFTNVNVCYSACESLGQINGSFFRYHFLANFGVFWARVKMYPKLYSVTAIRSPYFS